MLGTAAGGGFPQWNCRCRVCEIARSEPARALPRTQSQVAISADGAAWYLLNASPDLSRQIANASFLQPAPGEVRGSPIAGVLLTNADLDHTLGLALLREGAPLVVYGTGRVRESITAGIGLLPMLEAYCGLIWREVGAEDFALCDRSGKASGLTARAFDIPGNAPKYHRVEPSSAVGDSVGYAITDQRTGGCLMFAPDVSRIDAELQSFVGRADVVLFDGTFWSADEMQKSGTGAARTARDMGHVPISGPDGSLETLAGTKATHTVYVHINNTNPILIEVSAERKKVEECGIQVGRDGMEFEI